MQSIRRAVSESESDDEDAFADPIRTNSFFRLSFGSGAPLGVAADEPPDVDAIDFEDKVAACQARARMGRDSVLFARKMHVVLVELAMQEAKFMEACGRSMEGLDTVERLEEVSEGRFRDLQHSLELLTLMVDKCDARMRASAAIPPE